MLSKKIMDYIISQIKSLSDFSDYLKLRHQFNLIADSDYKFNADLEHELDMYDLKSSYFSVSLKTESSFKVIGFVRITPSSNNWPQEVMPSVEIRNFISSHFDDLNRKSIQGIPMQDYFGNSDFLNSIGTIDNYCFEIGRLIFSERNIGLRILINMLNYCFAVSMYSKINLVYARVKKSHLKFYQKNFNIDILKERQGLDYIPICVKWTNLTFQSQETITSILAEFSKYESIIPISFQNHKLK
jgi:hypothetical protein